jgi:hypothetical protein
MMKPPKRDSGIFVEEECSNPRCRKKLGIREPKYVLRIGAKRKPYCRDYARALMGPPETQKSEEEGIL